MPTTAEEQLRRLVMTCMLWEDNFYESGKTVAQRITELVPGCHTQFLVDLAIDAREKSKLRHVPLLLLREMARHPVHKAAVANLLAQIVQRADELTEFLSIYWRDGRQPVSAQVKKGLARAFAKFNEYQLAKYDRDAGVKLRDVLFLSHARPTDAQGRDARARQQVRKDKLDAGLNPHEELYRKVAQRELTTPDTWEVKLSALGEKAEGKTDEQKAEGKRAEWMRLLEERKLGALAFLRNLRNMQEAGISTAFLAGYANTLNVERVLPFRFLAAAYRAPELKPVLEQLMMRCLEGQAKLPGKTALLVDVSGSMGHTISSKSDLRRIDAGYGLAVLLREVCEAVEVFTFSNMTVQVEPLHGFALCDAMERSQLHNGTYLGQAIMHLTLDSNRGAYDRLIVITDEQSADEVPQPSRFERAYMINVASNQNGVGYGNWVHIDGWSEQIVDFIGVLERAQEKK